MDAFRCATAQFRHRPNDKAYNLAVIERLAAEAAFEGARIVAFPEMCVTGYWHVRNLGRARSTVLPNPCRPEIPCRRWLVLRSAMGSRSARG